MADSYAGDLQRQEDWAGAGLLVRRVATRSSRTAPALGRDIDGHALAERIQRFILANSSQRVSLTQLEALTGCTAFQIIKAFRRALGTTPHAYVIETRIRCAIALLKQGVPTAQAAQEVGFVDQSHFIRHFKRHCGSTPARYLKQLTTSPAAVDRATGFRSSAIRDGAGRQARVQN